VSYALRRTEAHIAPAIRYRCESAEGPGIYTAWLTHATDTTVAAAAAAAAYDDGDAPDHDAATIYAPTDETTAAAAAYDDGDAPDHDAAAIYAPTDEAAAAAAAAACDDGDATATDATIRFTDSIDTSAAAASDKGKSGWCQDRVGCGAGQARSMMTGSAGESQCSIA